MCRNVPASLYLEEGFDPSGFGGPGHLGLCPEPVYAYSKGISSIQEPGFKDVGTYGFAQYNQTDLSRFKEVLLRESVQICHELSGF